MAKRPVTHIDQLSFAFAAVNAPRVPTQESDLAGLERAIAGAIGRVLKDDSRSRGEIAGAMSSLLDEDISRFMLDAYASEAREGHNVSASRFLALIAVTRRFDVLDGVLERIGARLLVGEEVHAARLGHLEAKRQQLDAEIAQAKRLARPMARGGSL
jgi:hypothetical protein